MAKDIKPEERILNVVPSRNPENDWTFQTAVQADILAASAAEIPNSVDLREPWWQIEEPTPYGDCWFAAADAILRWHCVKKGILSQNTLLSIRSIGVIWMAATQMSEFPTTPATSLDAGTSLKDMLDIARKYGCVPASMPPFDAEKMCQKEVQAFFAIASKFKIANYFNLRPPKENWDDTKNNWRTWLATKGPILTALNVDATWDNAKQTQGKLDVYKPNTVRGGHCVAFVGYTQDRFIVRNSWGLNWGDQGFGYASEAYARAAFMEAYGITL